LPLSRSRLRGWKGKAEAKVEVEAEVVAALHVYSTLALT